MSNNKDNNSFTPAQRWVLALVSAGSFMAALDALVVTTALGTLRQEMGASPELLEWTVNAYGLSFAALLMMGAALGDRFGRRRLFVAGLLIFAVASAGCALAPGMGWLIFARACQGAGAALVMPLAMALLGAAFAPAQRARALGLFSGITGLAVLSGPVVGGAVIHGLAWQWIFWINLPFALVLAVLARLRIAESKGAAGVALDVRGALLMSTALLALVWALVHGNRAGWLSVRVLAPLAAAVVLGALFVTWQRRAPHAMVAPRLFQSPVFAAGNTAGFLLTAALYGALFFMAQFFQAAQGKGPLQAGLSMLPWTATLFIVAPVAGGLVRRVGERLLVMAGLALQAAGMVWLALLAYTGAAYAQWVLPLAIAGAGVSMAMPAVQSAVLGAVAPPDIGKAAGVFNTLRQLGGVVGVAATVAVFTAAGGYAGDAAQFGRGFAAALCAAAALSLAGAAAALRLPGRPVQAPLNINSLNSLKGEDA